MSLSTSVLRTSPLDMMPNIIKYLSNVFLTPIGFRRNDSSTVQHMFLNNYKINSGAPNHLLDLPQNNCVDIHD